ncbi:SMI1/KNR4 family protein [Hymenobacter sp. DH14]|uniref:SMI1/KNR4 family protein n=1 Tax=Hymenobacter cyanobacteriorum TaxID=2926463 RepID=A0A9X1VIE1_9BACT|nr:SMI1/KNR4 family protein [Hymenobacter cyanobacteriorum]MCI1189253.1 SMI1/KNR4 family protein [Hymenobacter cyanobacteriorum]
MFAITEFWAAPFGHVSAPIVVTPEVVQEAEKRLGVRLPQLLIELLQIQNGGYTAGFVFPTDKPNSWAEGCVPLEELFGITLQKGPTGLSLMDSAYLQDEWGIPEKQVLLSGDGHWFISLDYRASPEPTVLWLDTEMGEEVEIASSFEHFLHGLIPTDQFFEEGPASA